MSKGIIRDALRAATERLREDRDELRRTVTLPDGSIPDAADRAVVQRLDELIGQCDEALKAGAVWTTGEVLAAVERVLGPISRAEASAIITALRTGHLTPVPPVDPEPEPPRPAA